MPVTNSVPVAVSTPVYGPSTLSWRSIFAGAFIALLCFAALISLGLGVGGTFLSGLSGGVRGAQSGRGLGIGSGVWLLLSVLISIFLGSVAASRASGWTSPRVGWIQGLTVCALFFGILFFWTGQGIGSSIGLIGNMAGNITGNNMGRPAAENLLDDSRVQQTVERALGDLRFRSPTDEVLQGMAARLIRGDEAGAQRYLSREAGISATEANRRIGILRNNLEIVLNDLALQASRALAWSGWALFITLVLGSLSGVLGGYAGARRLVTPEDSDTTRGIRAA